MNITVLAQLRAKLRNTSSSGTCDSTVANHPDSATLMALTISKPVRRRRPEATSMMNEISLCLK